MRTQGLGHLKIFKYPTGNRARHLPSCGAVPQPTAPPPPVKSHTLVYVSSQRVVWSISEKRTLPTELFKVGESRALQILIQIYRRSHAAYTAFRNVHARQNYD